MMMQLAIHPAGQHHQYTLWCTSWDTLYILWHWRQEPFCVDCKTYAKLSAFVKYVIKFVGRANPITNHEFAGEYVKNNKQNTYLIFVFLPYPIPNLDYVSHTRFNCVVIAKPFRYLNYEEDRVSAAYLIRYLDFVTATFVAPLTVQPPQNLNICLANGGRGDFGNCTATASWRGRE